MKPASFLSARDAGFSMPAEWERHERCWMAWPCFEELWGSHLAGAQLGFADVAKTISRFEPVTMLAPEAAIEDASRLCGASVTIQCCDLDDSWMRDIGPNFLKRKDELAASIFHFNAWGGKYPRYRKDAAVGHRLAESLGIRTFSSPITMEGGGINVDGEGTILTTEQCILNENRNPGITKAEAEQRLCEALGGEKVIWLAGDPLDDETDGHVDGLACFVRPGVVLVEQAPESSAEIQTALEKNLRALEDATDARGRTLEIHVIEEASGAEILGDRFCQSYINFYIANGGVVMPSYGIDADERARDVVQSCFPDREVTQVDVNDIAYGGGGIHCITQQQPA
ncbi:MAG: agmatine deiminase family protein [Gammaproteobacteria bacterium]